MVRGILWYIVLIARKYPAAAATITAMPFLETFNGLDLVPLRTLDTIVLRAPHELKRTVSYLASVGGLTDDQRTSLPLIHLEQWHPEAAQAIEALPWVQDGISPPPLTIDGGLKGTRDEARMVMNMMEWQLRGYQGHFSTFLSSAWFQDGLTPLEHEIVRTLMESIPSAHSQLSLQIVQMPFLESIDEDDLRIVYLLQEATWAGELRSLLALPALRDGIEDGQLAVLALEYLRLRKPEAAAKVEALSWVEDGVDSSEVDAVFRLHELGLESLATLDAVVSKPWVVDGMSKPEVSMVFYVTTIATRDEALAVRLCQMPFLDAVDQTDVAAMSRLFLFVFDEARRSFLDRVLSHPTLGGVIEDDDRGMVTAVLLTGYHASGTQRDDLLATLMDPAQVVSEERTVMLPLAGDVILSVLRANEISADVMDYLEQVVRGHEEYMGVQFPVDFVFMVVADVGRSGGGASGFLTIDDSWSPDFTYVIPHEAAHIYWAIPPRWLQEGSAEFMTWIANDKGTPLHTFTIGVDSCSSASNLSELERKTPAMISEASHCHYRMGFALFHDLYNSLGDAEFRRGFGELFRTLDADRSDLSRQPKCAVTESSPCYLKAAFVAGASSPEAAARTSDLIDRWYYGPQGASP